jgi:hypothetical protein
MIHRCVAAAFAVVALCLIAVGSHAVEAPTPLPGVASQVQGLEKKDGLLTLYLDQQRGKIMLELPAAADRDIGHQILYVEGLVTGLGSNDVGLDRGQIGPARLVGFRRVGGRVLVEEVNLGFRALSEDPNELRAVRQSFARSVLWGGEIVAEDGDGRVLVDFTSFVVRDAHGSARRLERSNQGKFSLDQTRSAVDLESCLVFPDNVELEALLTLHGAKPGGHVRETAPSPEWVTLTQHHSFLRLPDDGYEPREFDPRAGSFAISFADYATPLDQPLEKRWIVRHRLQKTDPTAARSRVVEPIVYYVDRGVPEPVRSALVEGASWWAQAFDAAGFIDAYRVELLPEGAHSLDARYIVIQWVHRSTRGWSYGGGIVDPRTGEMIKGHVSLGSLRVRQDRLLYQGLAGADKLGSGEADDPVEIALARIRQLSAHEVGHTLGLTHNFAASTFGRESVMDYPAPLVKIDDNGDLDFSQAYGVGVGAWDEQTIRRAYAQFLPGADEAAELDKIVRDGLDRGLVFLSDADARPAGAAHPLANLWDNGADPVEWLAHTLEVRQIALDRFGESVVPEGTPLAELEAVLVPVYLHHRYQLLAALKVVGGLDYSYAVRGDGQPPTKHLDPARQQRALDVILSILDPAALDIPESILRIIPPRPFGYGAHREQFNGRTDPVLDPLGAAATAAEMVVSGLLQPERAARLVDFHRRDPAQPGLETVLDALIAQTFGSAAEPDERLAEIGRVVQVVTIDGLIALSANPVTTPGVRSRVDARLGELREDLAGVAGDGLAETAHRAALAANIERYLERDIPPNAPPPPATNPPPGDPIGS